MNRSIQKVLLAVMGALSMYFYYIYYPIHGTSKEYFLVYILGIVFVYGMYKWIQALSEVQKVHINVIHLLWAFLLHLFFLSCFFFGVTTGQAVQGVVLFTKISFIFFCISGLWLLFYSFGATCLNYIKNYVILEDKRLKIIISMGLGFSIFILLVFLLAYIGLYNIYAILWLVVVTWTVSYKKIVDTLIHLKSPLKAYDLKKPSTQIACVIDEIQYIIITFLLSVNLINVFRPFPIGWDDLGVYMNFPKLLSGAWELLPLGQMYLWQLYTGLGFLAGSQMYAFFLNTFSWIIVSITVYLAIKILIPQKNESYDFGLLAVIILLMMPMSVFQLAKDMKLDYGLLTISVIALALLYTTLYSKDSFSHKKSLWALWLVWFFIGIAFSIKLTSLLLLLSAIWLIFYKKFSLLWFFSFFSAFVGIFTYLGLWSMMNVLIPELSDFWKNIFCFSTIGWWTALLFYINSVKNKWMNPMRNLSVEIWILLIWFILALLPWGIKHIWEIPEWKWMSVGSLIGWYSDVYRPDYESIYSQEQLSEIEWVHGRGLTSSGTTTNEDFGRYFGYEKWINNYLKLPWNLTFQTNQWWEFTDITYIFFALIPLIFIVLPYRKEIYRWPVLWALVLLLLYYIPSSVSAFLTIFIEQIQIPFWYVWIWAFLIVPFIYFYCTLDKSKIVVKLFLANYAFSVIYVFLWSISAFWIVWYGILMYFVFIIMILLALVSTEEDEKHHEQLSYIVLIVIWVYVLLSAIPHGVTNIRSAGYGEYKLGYYTEESSIMRFHPDYFPILWTLNVAEDKKEKIFLDYRNQLLEIIDANPNLTWLRPRITETSNITDIQSILAQIENISEANINRDIIYTASKILQNLYTVVIYPEKEYRNTEKIYKSGTFLKYFISGNYSRIIEDSLLSKFWTYLQDNDSNVTLERFKKIWIKYILIDLNAATIDNDSRRALTGRYENMLKFTTNTGLEFVESDSMCLRLWRDLYEKNGDMDEYLLIAGSNYDSPGMWRQQKRNTCAKKIIELIQSWVVDENNYPSLLIYIQLMNQSNIPLSDAQWVADIVSKRLPIWYKALFKIK